MGYVRAARIVFFSGHPDGLAQQASNLTNQLGTGWMEARPAISTINSVDLAWADLVVTVDAAARTALPTAMPGVQHRHYPFEPGTEPADMQHDRLRARIEGMLGGLRLLQRASMTDEQDG